MTNMIIDPYKLQQIGGDPYFTYVSSLLHFNGSDGSTTFTDVTGKVWTPFNAVQIDTAESVFGGASMLQTATDYIECASSADFGYGAADFCIEFRVRFSSVSGFQLVYDQRTLASPQPRPTIYLNSSQLHYYVDNITLITTGLTLSVNTWYAVAVVRLLGAVQMYIDGVAYGGNIADTTNYEASHVLVGTPGNDPGNSAGFQGHIDELRITKGFARYFTTYTPAAAAFPDN